MSFRTVRCAGLLPLSVVFLPLALSAQSGPDASAGKPGPGLGTSASSAGASSSPQAPEQPVDSVNSPSFYGSAPESGSSSLGLPSFAAAGPSVKSPTPPEYPLRWGPFSAHPHLTYGLTYADGVLYRPGSTTTTILNTISPGLTIESAHLSIDYTPSLNYYAKGPYEDSLNHSANLLANFGYGDWIFRIEQAYQEGFNPTIETGTQTQTESHNTSITATWNFNANWFFDFSLSQQLLSSQGFQGRDQWSTMDWINYRLTPELSFGAGVGGGYSKVDIGPDMAFEQFQGRVSWHPSRKLSVNLNGGIEVRQFIDVAGSDDLINPIMGASILYQVFDHTSLFLAANRAVDSSFFANQITETASVSGGINQRLLQHFNLDVSLGYRNTEYKNTFVFFNQFFTTARRDDYAYVSTSLGTTFLKKGTATVSYLHGDNQSTLQGYTYATDQISLQIGYRF